jgi:hypothetical protein
MDWRVRWVFVGRPGKGGSIFSYLGKRLLVSSSDILTSGRHHQVESVHFTTSSKRLLHPAVAVIQTPSREYFILKENGMQIGCEEEGVAEVWMEILGCTATGEKV